MKTIFALAVLLLLLGFAGAGTVTLTGVCSSGVINNATSYATFALSNSGNETATSLVILPKFFGASSVNASQTLQSLSPGQNLTTKFYFDNFSTPGSYAGSFTVAYSQDASTFFALFPCILNFVNQTTSLADISAINQSGNTISVSLVNIGLGTLNVNVSVLLPPEFYAYPSSQSVSLQAGAVRKVNFSFTQPAISQASYAIAASASYDADGLHYATMRQSVLNFYKGGATAGQLGQYLPYIAIVVVILLIVSLIIFSVIRKKRHAHSPPGGGKVGD